MTAPSLRVPMFLLRHPSARCSSCIHRYQRRAYAAAALSVHHPSEHLAETPQSRPAEQTHGSDLPSKSKKNRAQKTRDEDVPRRKRRQAINSNEDILSAPRRSLLQLTKVEEYLASLAADAPLTLADIERCRPRSHGPPGSPQYEQDYIKLVNTLTGSFSSKQLRNFGQMYSLPPQFIRAHLSKLDYAVAIIERQWSWPSLPDIKKEQMELSVIDERLYPLSPSQMFIIIGKDGADLLSMSKKYDVKVWPSSKPFGLKVQGLVGNLRSWTDYIEALKADILEETFQLPFNTAIRPDLLQRISRIAGAHIDNFGSGGQVRICAKDHHSLLVAKRLAVRAASEIHEVEPPLLSYNPVEIPNSTPIPTSIFPYMYSVYPFMPHRSLPWTVSTGRAFRIRRVGEWINIDSVEDVHQTGGLAEGRGRILTLSEQPNDIRLSLLGSLPQLALDSTRSITASLGHILLTSPIAQRADIMTPLKGHWSFPKILQWLQDEKFKPAFTPSLPVALFNSPPSQQRILHRLLYNAVPVRPDSTIRPPEFFKCEVVLHEPKSRIQGSSDMSSASFSPAESLAPNLQSDAPFTYKCWSGSEAVVDLLTPDRPMDIRFSVSDSITIPNSRLPSELANYISELSNFLTYADGASVQPDPPLLFTHGNITYSLHSSTSVRQSMESAGSMKQSSVDILKAISESQLDLESTQKSTHCKITCDNPTSDDDWKRFLRNCDRLTTINHYDIGDNAARNSFLL